MLVCKRSDFSKKGCAGILLIIISLLLLPVNSLAQSSGISVKKVNGQANQTMLNINADISYRLSKETIDAIDHGIPLEFDIDIRIKRNRDWFWDRTIITKRITYRIEYQPLSGQYLVTEIYSGDINQFHNLEDVLNFIGALRNYPVIGIDMLFPEYDYTVQIKSQLDIQALPAPLRPLAYISSQWRLASPWRSWVIQL